MHMGVETENVFGSRGRENSTVAETWSEVCAWSGVEGDAGDRQVRRGHIVPLGENDSHSQGD